MTTFPRHRFTPLLATALVAGACSVDQSGLGTAASGGAGGGTGGGTVETDAGTPSDVEPAPDAPAPFDAMSCGTSQCPACFRCGSGGSCEVDPGSLWKLKCISASISATSPGGGAWDSNASGNAQAPDPVCELWLGQASAARTSVQSNTLEPMWNESITPSMRPTASFLMSQQMPWSIRVSDDDGANQSPEDICVVIPQLAPGAFTESSITFSNVQSCDTLVVGLDCVPR